ncbi:MAG: superoxide reductase [Deltaproteobacteria bacterium]|nr:superoxide reductase [Deltaproteobacteria bacterium]
MMRSFSQRFTLIIALAGLVLAQLLAGVFTAPVWAGQAEQFTPEFHEMHKNFDPKHTPKIVAPDSVKRGQWFDVTLSVGTDSDHPSLSEHFVRYIALYIDSAEIGRVYLHPVYSFPKVTFTIALDKGGVLRAVEEPTHSSAWEGSKKIAVLP